MTCKVTVQKNTFAESLAIVGRVVGSHTHLPILSNILLSKDEGLLRLSATNLNVGVTVWMDAKMDGELGLTLPARTLTDVINTLTDPEVIFSVNGKPEVSLKSGTYKGVVKGIEASEFPTIPEYPITNGVSIDASMFKEMIQKVAFAASMDDARPVLSGVLMSMDGKTLSMVGTDGFRLAINKTSLPEPFAKKQLIIPASSLKEVMRILTATKTARITLVLPPNGSQAVLRCENVQIVSQLIDGNFPDYQAIIPKGYKTKAVVATSDLLKSCKQASIIAREGNNVVRFHFYPGDNQTGKVVLLAESDETGTSEIELTAMVEGQELEIAFNVKFLQDGLETITTKNVIIEANAHNTPAVIHSTGREASPLGEEEESLYVLMPMHIDRK